MANEILREVISQLQALRHGTYDTHLDTVARATARAKDIEDGLAGDAAEEAWLKANPTVVPPIPTLVDGDITENRNRLIDWLSRARMALEPLRVIGTPPKKKRGGAATYPRFGLVSGWFQ